MTAQNGNVIETTDLTKRYGDVVAVDHLTLRVPRGGVFGFLGPNGSGKTTTMGMLLGLVHPTSGEARIFGDPARHPATLPMARSMNSAPWPMPGPTSPPGTRAPSTTPTLFKSCASRSRPPDPAA